MPKAVKVLSDAITQFVELLITEHEQGRGRISPDVALAVENLMTLVGRHEEQSEESARMEFERYQAFDRAHPEVWIRFRDCSRNEIAEGADQCSAVPLFHELRKHFRGIGLFLSNNFAPYYARRYNKYHARVYIEHAAKADRYLDLI
jgi:hypothetical protein